MLEIQPTIAGEILKQGSFGLSLITTTAGIGALLASIWIGFRNSNKSKIETKLVSMLMLGLIIRYFLQLSVLLQLQLVLELKQLSN